MQNGEIIRYWKVKITDSFRHISLSAPHLKFLVENGVNCAWFVKYTNQEIRRQALTHDQEAASSIEDPDDPPDEDSGDEDAETPTSKENHCHLPARPIQQSCRHSSACYTFRASTRLRKWTPVSCIPALWYKHIPSHNEWEMLPVPHRLLAVRWQVYASCSTTSRQLCCNEGSVG